MRFFLVHGSVLSCGSGIAKHVANNTLIVIVLSFSLREKSKIRLLSTGKVKPDCNATSAAVTERQGWRGGRGFLRSDVGVCVCSSGVSR